MNAHRFPIRRKHLALAVAAGLSLHACLSHAQSVPRVEQDPAQRLIQERRERERQREAEQPPAQIDIDRPVLQPEAAAGTDVSAVADPEPTFLIDRIRLEGNTVLSEQEADAVIAPFLGKRLGTKRINLLLRRFVKRFVDKGLVTTRAYLGAQNLSAGVLTVTIVPGHIESIQVNGKTLRPSSSSAVSRISGPVNGGLLTDAGTQFALPASAGDVLDLTDLEQGVDQINRLRRNHAEMQILPGTTPGGSIVALSNKPGDRFRFTAGMDNYGSQGTGIGRTRLGVDADNLLGFQEALSVAYIGSLDSNALVLSTAVPYGYNTFSYTGSVSQYQSLIGTTALLYGDTLGHTLGWSRVLGRDSGGKTAMDLTLSHRTSGRDVNNLALDPQALTVLRAAINRQQRVSGNGQTAIWTAEAGVSRGLKAFGANADSRDIQNTEAHGQFTKLDGNASVLVPLADTGALRWLWRGQLSTQWARQALFGSEQIFAGGMGSVRGFRDGAISGDRGWYLRNDLILSNTPEWAGLHVEPYAFLDGGRTELIAEARYRQVVGTGIGVRMQTVIRKSDLSAELLLGRPLLQPDYLGPKRTVLLATINWTY